jgi:hypothetical protein
MDIIVVTSLLAIIENGLVLFTLAPIEAAVDLNWHGPCALVRYPLNEYLLYKDLN